MLPASVPRVRLAVCPLRPDTPQILEEGRMTWLMLAILVVIGFALLKVRRRRKAREASRSVTAQRQDSAAA